MIKYAKLGWTVLAVVVMLATLYFFDDQPNSDAEVVLIWGMLILSFPISILCALIITLVYDAIFTSFGDVIASSIPHIITIWTIYFLFGYWQWFYLLPAIYKKVRKMNGNS